MVGGGGGQVRFYPYKKVGVGGWGDGSSFSHAELGGGGGGKKCPPFKKDPAQSIPRFEGGGAKHSRNCNFPML